MKNTLLLPLLLAIAALSIRPISAAQAGEADRASDATQASDRSTEAEQGEAGPAELIDLAFRAASSLPLDPHVKDVTRMQERVVEAALAVDLPAKALAFAQRIPDWRRGSAHASVAVWHARRGATAEARAALAVATEVAQGSEEEFGQSWRKDRVRAGVAEALALLGDEAQSARFAEGVEESQAENVRTLRARTIDAKDFDAELKAMQELADTGDFDVVRNALSVCAELHAAFYEDEKRRDRAAETIQGAWQKLPGQIRVDLACRLADAAVEHDDAPRALALVDEASAMVKSSGWTLEYRLPLVAQLALRRSLAGDAEAARLEADAALASFHEGRSSIVDMFRAKALVPLAEAYAAMGREEQALAVYQTAMTEALENQNSRPRAEDVVLITTSMAIRGVAPDENLWGLLRHVCDTLGHEYAR